MSYSTRDGVEFDADRLMKDGLQDVETRIRTIHESVFSVDRELRDELADLAQRLSDLEYAVRRQRPRTNRRDRWSGIIVLIAAFTVCAYLVQPLGLPIIRDMQILSMISDAIKPIFGKLL